MAEEGTGLGRLLQNESARKGLLELKVVEALRKSMDVSSIERLMSVREGEYFKSEGRRRH